MTYSPPRLTQYLVSQDAFSSTPLQVMDIGARGGFEHRWQVFKEQIHLIGLEANREECDNLNHACKAKNQTYYPYALHRERGTHSFYETYFPASSGFYEPDTQYFERFWTGLSKRVLKDYPLETISVDQVIAQENLSSFDFLKIDTEGGEFDILQGAESCLDSELLGIDLEAWMTPMHKGQGIFCDIDRFLRDRGFEMFNMDVFRYARKALGVTTHNLFHGSGQVLWSQVLYLRDISKDLETGAYNWSREKVLKMLAFFEIFHLNDCAAELILTASEHGIFTPEEQQVYLDLIVPIQGGEQALSYQEYQAYIVYKDLLLFLFEVQVISPENTQYIKSMLYALDRGFTRLALNSIMKNCAFLETLEIKDAHRMWLTSYYERLKDYQETIIELSESQKVLRPRFTSRGR